MPLSVRIPSEAVAKPPEPSKLSPEELAQRCQGGCRDSFELLVAHFEKRVHHFLWQLVRNNHDAEDLTQETFVAAYKGLHRYQSRYAFATWLFTIAKRTAVDHFRTNRRLESWTEEVQSDGETDADMTDPSTLLESQEELGSIWKAARSLKPKHHEALWLRYGEGFSVAETASIMGTNQIHVKVLLHRGRAQLALSLGRAKKNC